MGTQIRVGFSRSRHWYALFSHLIRWVECRPYSHVYVEMKDPGVGEDVVMQASKGMVNMFHMEHFNANNVVTHFFTLQLTQAEYLWVWRYFIKRMGLPYGTNQIFGIFLKKLFRLTGVTRDGEKTFVCSEIIFRLMYIKMRRDRKVMSARYLNLDPDEATPSDVDSAIDGHYPRTQI